MIPLSKLGSITDWAKDITLAIAMMFLLAEILLLFVAFS